MQSLAEEPLPVQDELCVPEYTGDIYLHLRGREVRSGPECHQDGISAHCNSV